MANAYAQFSMRSVNIHPSAKFLFIGILLTACGQPIEGAPIDEMPLIEDTTAPSSIMGGDDLTSAESGTSLRVVSTPIPVELPTAAPIPTSDWRPPPYPAPWAIRPEDHFLFDRPIPSGEVNWPNSRYRYGSTLFGEENIHTGVDLGADRGTSVLASGPGEVVWTGYGLYRGIYDETDPYGLAVAIRHDFGHHGQQLYTVYAHMQSICVWEGQRVQTGEILGTVGDTGHASGPHLHFEVRLGENRYWTTFNPELWIAPPIGWGVLAGRVEDSFGSLLKEYLVQIYSIETGERWDVWTYAEGTIHSDEFYSENFVISDLPAGPYEVHIDFIGRSFTTQLYLYPGQTNFLVFRGRSGFNIEPTPTPVNLTVPPDL
ncbi:MAG TPA: peptidoglycan DD-metalloendopeptidase family protein [Anaerolineae bacterium]|nr:peptidoglycan DD-metalloendopeptidase family protein [Anaerolineae bacterium]